MKTFKDRVAVMTGAGGGLGRALAIQFASQGCHLALVDVNSEALEQSSKAISAALSSNSSNATSTPRISQHVADVTSSERMSRLPAEIIEIHGKVHLLINNAGITIQKNFATHSIADWERMIGINLWGVIHGCHYFHEHLVAAEEAHVVNLSSMSAFAGLPGQASYCATKAAVKALSESIFEEWSLDGIGVTSVHPGAIRTEMIQATLAESDDIEAAQRNYELAQRTGVDAEHAARKIFQAVQKGKVRVRIGKDSLLLDWIKRIAPSRIHHLMIGIAKQQRPKTQAN